MSKVIDTDYDFQNNSIENAAIYKIAIANEVINGGKVVVFDNGGVKLYDVNDESNYGKITGIAANAANEGEEVRVCVHGVITEVSSGWIADQIYYIGTNSLPSVVPPTSGIVKIIGTGFNVDQIFVNQNSEIITI